jgi:preprotein translocase subunit SecG
MNFLSGAILVLFIFSSIFLILLVMVQSGKGGSLGLSGGASQTAFGSSSADIMTKATRFIAVFFVVSAFLLSFLFAKRESIISPATPEQPVIEPAKDSKEAQVKEAPTKDSKTTPEVPVQQPAKQ